MNSTCLSCNPTNEHELGCLHTRVRASARALARGPAPGPARGQTQGPAQGLTGKLTATFATLFVFLAPAAAAPISYTLDSAHSAVHFELLHFNTSTIRGRFAGVQGGVTLDAEAQKGEASVRIPTASVSTGVPVFDARIRQGDLLATEAHPEAFFVASQFIFDGPSLVGLRGEFTLRGTSQPLSLRALRFGCRTASPGAEVREICAGDFEGEFLRSAFGATLGLPFVADRVRLIVQIQGFRK